jgi:simple sugar transport system ATP-binding protein
LRRRLVCVKKIKVEAGVVESATSGAPTPVIELRNASKTFGEVRALSGVNFKVNPAEIVGLLGDNGSGKSTLVKLVMGYYAPDAGGEIWFHGEREDNWLVAKARKLGIETVYQERALCEKQPIWRNMFMGRELRNRSGLLDVPRMRAECSRLMSEHMGFTSAAVHPNNIVATMSGGEKQGVAITRALYFEAELVILDEPTMGLSLTETKKTLDFVRHIKDVGKSAIFIDHNIFNVYPAVDRLYVLDRGKIAGVFNRADITMDQLIERLYHVARTGTMELPS